ncbi:MAG: hypothetical protein MUQ32_11315, partial [Chloroflexi bacterium]|nr:hypothetical protein [Chloroflexota bacterium]
SKSGTMKSLTSKLDAAEKSVAKGNSKAAVNQLEAFISEVKAQSGKSITPQAAAILIADAKYLIANL